MSPRFSTCLRRKRNKKWFHNNNYFYSTLIILYIIITFQVWKVDLVQSISQRWFENFSGKMFFYVSHFHLHFICIFKDSRESQINHFIMNNNMVWYCKFPRHVVTEQNCSHSEMFLSLNHSTQKHNVLKFETCKPPINLFFRNFLLIKKVDINILL